jgi:hypothetical protein
LQKRLNDDDPDYKIIVDGVFGKNTKAKLVSIKQVEQITLNDYDRSNVLPENGTGTVMDLASEISSN